MSKTESGYQITIRAFLPCGATAAEHARAKSLIEQMSADLGSDGCSGIDVQDVFKPRRKVAEPSDG